MQYACMEFKPFYKNNHNAEAYRMRELEEAKGELLRIFDAEGQCIAIFSWGPISLPLDLRDELRELVGMEIAILRLEGRFYVRRVD